MKRIMGSRLLLGCSAGLLFSLSAYAQQRPSAADIDALVASIKSSLAESSQGAVAFEIGKKQYDAATGDLTLSEIMIEAGDPSKGYGSIGSITADNLALDQGGGLSADSFKVVDSKIVITDADGNGEFSLPAITVANLRMPTALPQADAAGVTDYLAWAKRFAWSSFVIGKASGKVAGSNGRLDISAELDEQTFGALADGNIDLVKMFGVKVSGKVPREFSDTETDAIELNWGQQTVEGLNFGAYTLFMTGVGDKGERPAISMMKKAVIGPVSMKLGSKLSMNFQGAESGEILMRPMRIGYGSLLGLLLSGKEPNLSPDAPIEELRIWGTLFEDLPDLVEAKSFIYKGFDMTISDPEPVLIKMGSIVAENIKTVSYGKLAFNGVEVNGDGVSVGMDLFEIRDLDLSGIYRELGGMVRSRFVPNFSSIERNLPLLGKWEIKGVRASKTGEGEISLRRAALDFGAYVGVIPGSIDFAIEELAMSGAFLKETSPPTPADLGYNGITLSAGAKLFYDQAKSAIVVGPIFASGKDMGTITFNAQFGGISRVLLSVASIAGAAMNGGQSYLDGIRFDGFTLDITDAELLNRALAYEGKQQGKSLADTKAEAKDKAAIALSSGPLGPEFATKISDAVSAFIDNPASLRIVVQAKQPVTLRDLSEIESRPEIFSRFSVEATANAQ